MYSLPEAIESAPVPGQSVPPPKQSAPVGKGRMQVYSPYIIHTNFALVPSSQQFGTQLHKTYSTNNQVFDENSLYFGTQLKLKRYPARFDFLTVQKLYTLFEHS